MRVSTPAKNQTTRLPGRLAQSATKASRNATRTARLKPMSTTRSDPGMPTARKAPKRRPAKSRGLVREVAYPHRDEADALARNAEKERTSKSEIIRRALRAYLGVDD